jgi:uncharacterized protein YukE
MARVKSELAEVAEYANYLMQMQGEIEASKASLISTIQSINGAWTGEDADTFVANATAYLENLSVIGNLLAQYGAAVGTKVRKYAQAIDDFYSALG